MRRTRKRIMAMVALGLWMGVQPAGACTTLIVTKGASEEGATLVAHSDDNELCDERIIFVPAADHKPGSKRSVYASAVAMGEFPEYGTFLYPRLVTKDRGPGYDTAGSPKTVPLGAIPQVAHTYAYFDGSYGIMNEHQLMFGECTDGVKVEQRPEPGKRMFYASELSRVALERCRTAREAVELMGSLIETYGYYGTGETLPVADPHEAWVMEMAPSPDGIGGLWVAQRVPDGEVFVATNEFRIRDVVSGDPAMLFSKRLFAVAEAQHWWHPGEGPLDWLRAVSQGEYNNPYYSLRRLWRIFSRIAPSRNFSPWVQDGFTRDYPFSIKPDKKLSVRDVFSLYRDHYEGTSFDMTQGVAAGPFGYPDRFRGPADGHGDVGDPKRTLEGAWERPISVSYCGYTVVCQGRGDLPDAIGGRCWIGLDKPADTVFVPFFVVPKALPGSFQTCDTGKFSRASAWWAFNFVANWAGLRYAMIHADVAKRQDMLESAMLVKLAEVEAKALALHRQGSARLLPYLASFSAGNAEAVVAQWWKFSEELIVKYNDGYVNEPGKMAQEVGYPQSWLDLSGWRLGPTRYAPPQP